MDRHKRTLEQTSPDLNKANTPKKILIKRNITTNKTSKTNSESNYIVNFRKNNTAFSTMAAADCFSWSIFDQKLNTALDEKLKSVVKKEDLAPISAEIQQLRSENTRLQKEIQTMKNRLEAVDKASRRNNVVVSGLKANNVSDALTEFKDMCNYTLKTNVNVVDVHKIANGKSFIFLLGSPMEAKAITAQKRLLVGSKIYIDKDYTADERSKKYFLRQIGKNAKIANNCVKVRHGDHRVFINDKPFSWAGGKIIAANNLDAIFLRDLLFKANFECEIGVKSQTTSTDSIPMSANGLNLN